MQINKCQIDGLWIIEPDVLGDSRGYFSETFKKDLFEKTIRPINFIQDNESKSSCGVIRGLHIQKPPYTQAKLVRCVLGKVLDFAVDIRTDSPTFGQYMAVELSGDNHRQFFIDRGFAHGFVVLSQEAIFQYKVDNVYCKTSELGIRFNDKDINIEFLKNQSNYLLSQKDQELPLFKEQSYFTKEEYFTNPK